MSYSLCFMASGARMVRSREFWNWQVSPMWAAEVLASAVSMDKLYTKIIVDSIGVAQAAYVPVLRRELKDMNTVVARVESRFSYPVFVKPSCAGSSKGVSKATDRESLIHALEVAAAQDVKILVEEMIVGRELECAIFNSGETEASGIGEILAAADFYDYDAKYNNAESRTVIDPELPEGKMDEIREAAKAIFQAVDGCGLARVDFFLEKDTNRVIFNEINTLPGFTAISMYPMLWEARGRKKPELVEALIQFGLHSEGISDECKCTCRCLLIPASADLRWHVRSCVRLRRSRWFISAIRPEFPTAPSPGIRSCAMSVRLYASWRRKR